jgi:hypothetical protein
MHRVTTSQAQAQCSQLQGELCMVGRKWDVDAKVLQQTCMKMWYTMMGNMMLGYTIDCTTLFVLPW